MTRKSCHGVVADTWEITLETDNLLYYTSKNKFAIFDKLCLPISSNLTSTLHTTIRDRDRDTCKPLENQHDRDRDTVACKP